MVKKANNPLQPLTQETAVGITTFYTPYHGMGGKLRSIPEDFQVTEIPILPPEKPDGRYLLTWISSKNWDTHLLVKTISNHLNISQNRISFAGTKDKRAVTTQLMTIADISQEQLNALQIPDATLNPVYRVQQQLHLGQLKGNHFSITIRKLTPTQTPTLHEKYDTFFSTHPGFPNYFGIQRFGGIRPLTHHIGKAIIHNDYQQAVMLYLTQTFPEEEPTIQKIRQTLKKDQNYQKALTQFPKSFRYERALLSGLIEYDDYVKALLNLPKKLLLMFINAYQSYLYNKMISARIQQNLPLDQAIPGDIIQPFTSKNNTPDYIPATETNLTKINHQIKKNHAAVTSLLLGNTPLFAEGTMGEIEHHIIDQEKIKPAQFINTHIPFLSSSGIRRPIYTPVTDLTNDLQPDDQNTGYQKLILTFSLSKGSYASVFLREWMKASHITDY